MFNQVIPPEIQNLARIKASGGEDYIELFNGSKIHFCGLEDPLRWYSSEIGYVFFDECQEIEEDTVLRIMTRLRQRCRECERNSIADCSHMPNRAIMTFNPGNPGHWLQRWFIIGGEKKCAERTAHGFYVPELWLEGAIKPISDAEFVFAKAADNWHLPPGYVDDNLGGMKEWMRRRYLEGIWEFISGSCFFDVDSLRDYELAAREVTPICNGETVGNIKQDVDYRTGSGPKPKGIEKITVNPGHGPLTIFKKPVKQLYDEKTEKLLPAHRYVVAVDSSSGRGTDFSAIEVIDIDEFEQVAEWQDKKETGLVAEEAYRLGRIYNDALIVTEITGGWGLAVDQVLKRLRYPRLYTRRTYDRLSSKYTDRTGFETQTRMRNVTLEALDSAIRNKEIKLYSLRAINEMGTFVYSDKEKPEAQPGCNDDLVLALAIGVKVAADLPRQLRVVKEKVHIPQFSVTGY